MPKHQKKEKVTWGYVILFGIMFLIFDISLRRNSLWAFLYGLGVFELIGMGALIARATWDSLPKGVQKELKKLS